MERFLRMETQFCRLKLEEVEEKMERLVSLSQNTAIDNTDVNGLQPNHLLPIIQMVKILRDEMEYQGQVLKKLMQAIIKDDLARAAATTASKPEEV